MSGGITSCSYAENGGYDTVTADNGWFLSGEGEGVTMALDAFGRPESPALLSTLAIRRRIVYALLHGFQNDVSGPIQAPGLVGAISGTSVTSVVSADTLAAGFTVTF